MDSQQSILNRSTSYWFVGAVIDDVDVSDTFIAEGRWQNGYEEKYLELVRSIQAGDQIAIKSTFTRRNNLPFDTRGNTVKHAKQLLGKPSS